MAAKKMPEPQIDASKIYRVTITTDRGPIVMDLDPQLAPNTVNNFIGLARDGYYDNLTFHRVVPEFVIQGGCPEGSGRGGPTGGKRARLYRVGVAGVAAARLLERVEGEGQGHRARRDLGAHHVTRHA